MLSQDSSIAYKRAVLNCIDYLHKFGYTKQQVRMSKKAAVHSREKLKESSLHCNQLYPAYRTASQELTRKYL